MTYFTRKIFAILKKWRVISVFSLLQYMFGALRDCVPQLKNSKHEEEPDKMVSDFKDKIMEIMKEV